MAGTHGTRLRIWLAGAFALAGLFMALPGGYAQPVQAKSSCQTLSMWNGTVSPGTGDPSTDFRFSIKVSQQGGSPPSVQVLVRETWSDMDRSGSTYEFVRSLPVGSWEYKFRAVGSGGVTCEYENVSPRAVIVNEPPPTPKPTPDPTPTPTPTPTPKPTPVSTTGPTPKPTPTATSKGDRTSTHRPGSVGTPRPPGTSNPRPGATANGSGNETPTAIPQATASPTPSPSPSIVVAGSGSSGGGGFTFDPEGVLDVILNPFTVWLYATTGGAYLFIFLTRRPMAAVASAGGQPSAALSAAGSAAPGAATGATTKPAPPRPPSRTFSHPPQRGVQRARIGYRRVRISSKPDEVRSSELGRLDRGDEVEILESHQGFLMIRTPDDVTGWIMRHTTISAPPD